MGQRLDQGRDGLDVGQVAQCLHSGHADAVIRFPFQQGHDLRGIVGIAEVSEDNKHATADTRRVVYGPALIERSCSPQQPAGISGGTQAA